MTRSSIVSTSLTQWTEAGTETPSPIDRLSDAAVSALQEAELTPGDLDGIFCNTTALPFDDGAFIPVSAQHFAQRLADKLGTREVRCMNVSGACASASAALAAADGMIKTGSCDTVLVGGVDNSPPGFYYQGPSTLDPDLTVSYPHKVVGITNPGYWAMWARRRAHEVGHSVDELKDVMATVKELQSQSGQHNPQARFTRTFSKDEIMDSPVICDPLHLFMIGGVSSGAGAAIVTSEEKAKELTDKPVTLAASEVGGPVHTEPEPRLIHFATAGGDKADPSFTEWCKPIERAYETAGIGSDDVDVIECHDTSCFHTINWIDQIMGWDREQTDQLIRNGEITKDGQLPVNLSGGTAAFGEAVMSQAFMMIHELVLQLRGEAGERQATDPLHTGLCTTYGGYGSYGATILESGW